MSFWSRPSTTSMLLAVIAILLLVLVIQNATDRSRPARPAPMAMAQTAAPFADGHNHPPMPTGSSGSAGQMPDDHNHPPMSGGGSGPIMSNDGDFDPSHMIYAALVCPDDPMITLAETACQGGEAEKRKATVKKAFEEKLPISKVFDRIVEAYGERALTAQAIQIRRMRRQ